MRCFIEIFIPVNPIMFKDPQGEYNMGNLVEACIKGPTCTINRVIKIIKQKLSLYYFESVLKCDVAWKNVGMYNNLNPCLHS